jgi:hypothetical protein
VRRALIAVLTVLVPVAGAEMYLRATTQSWLGPVVQQRWLLEQGSDGHLRPGRGFVGEITWSGRTTRVRTNSLGMRGPDLAEPRDGELRVLAVGDSMVFGFGCELEETLTHLLGPRLAAAIGGPVVARIGAAPGLGTADLPAVIERLRPEFRPDRLLVGVAMANDLIDIHEPTRRVIDGYMLSGPLGRAAERSLRIRCAPHSRVWFVVEHFLRTHVPSLAVDLPDAGPEIEAFRDFPPPAERTCSVFMDRDPATPAIERILDRFEVAMARVATAARGIDVVVVILPTVTHCHPARYEALVESLGWRTADYRRGALQERLIARCARLGLRAIDLTATLGTHEQFRSLFVDDETHLSPAGHAVVAAAMTDVLAQR